MNARGLLGAALAAFALLGPARAGPAVTPDPPAEVAEDGEDPFIGFDDFAWRQFLALNWPAAADGGPNRAATLSDPGARVWERFAPRDTLAPGARLGDLCGAPTDAKVVSATTPYAEFNQTSFTPGEADSPLVAQNHTYVRYETRFRGFASPAAAPAPWVAPEGAVAVKAAWRVLAPAEENAARARYYVARGWITDVAASRAAGRIVCAAADLALVGFHLVVRTRNSPQGVWASFEHVDNVPPVGVGDTREPDARDEGQSYSFNDPAHPQREWPPRGWRVADPVTADNPPRLDPASFQVVRAHPIRREIMAANRAYWAQPEVAASPWRRYMLVATQWPGVPAPRGPQNDGRYFPGIKPEPTSKAAKYKVAESDDGRNIANTVMETYQQDAPASCMACHHAVSNSRGYDFVGVMGAAPARN